MKTFSLVVIFSSLVYSQLVLAVDIQPGNWSVETTMSMGGANAMPANTTTICLKDVNQMVNAGAGCSAATTSANGGHVDMKISCNVSGMTMDGTGSLAVSQTTVDGTFNLAMQMAQGPALQTVSTLHAVRVGDCKQ